MAARKAPAAPSAGRTTDAELELPSFEGRTNLRQQVGDSLRAHLVTGRMRPGGLYSAPRPPPAPGT